MGVLIALVWIAGIAAAVVLVALVWSVFATFISWSNGGFH